VIEAIPNPYSSHIHIIQDVGLAVVGDAAVGLDVELANVCVVVVGPGIGLVVVGVAIVGLDVGLGLAATAAAAAVGGSRTMASLSSSDEESKVRPEI